MFGLVAAVSSRVTAGRHAGVTRRPVFSVHAAGLLRKADTLVRVLETSEEAQTTFWQENLGLVRYYLHCVQGDEPDEEAQPGEFHVRSSDLPRRKR